MSLLPFVVAEIPWAEGLSILGIGMGAVFAALTMLMLGIKTASSIIISMERKEAAKKAEGGK